MKRDDDPPRDEPHREPGPSLDLRWQDQLSRDELRRWRAVRTASDPTAPFATEEWIEAFCKEYSRELMESVRRYAARRLSKGGPVSPYADDASALASDALNDTLSGEMPWGPDPDGKSLRRHLFDVVRRRTSAAWERAQRLPHVSIDALASDGETAAHHEMEQAMREQLPDARDQERARNDVAELQRRAAGDPDVLALIEAIASDQTSRADAMSVTGFSPQRYRAARRRLHRIVADMRAEVAPNRESPE